MTFETYSNVTTALFLLFFIVAAFRDLGLSKLIAGMLLSLVWPALPVLAILLAARDDEL